MEKEAQAEKSKQGQNSIEHFDGAIKEFGDLLKGFEDGLESIKKAARKRKELEKIILLNGLRLDEAEKECNADFICSRNKTLKTEVAAARSAINTTREDLRATARENEKLMKRQRGQLQKIFLAIQDVLLELEDFEKKNPDADKEKISIQKKILENYLRKILDIQETI